MSTTPNAAKIKTSSVVDSPVYLTLNSDPIVDTELSVKKRDKKVAIDATAELDVAVPKKLQISSKPGAVVTHRSKPKKAIDLSKESSGSRLPQKSSKGGQQVSTTSSTSPVITKVKSNKSTKKSTKSFLPEIALKKLPIASNRTPRERARLNSLTFNVVRDLSTFGICVIDNFIPKERGLAILKEVFAISKSGLLQDGELVSSPECKNNVKSIRSDKIAWVTGQENFATNIGSVISDVDYIVVGANRMPSCGKLGDYTINSRSKAMIACYPGSGTHYVKHVDNPNQDGRCITAIYYLNVNWNVEKYGGLLRIFPDGFSDQVANIEPMFNRLLIFWSDRRNPHEVQPSFKTRYAITLWYIDEVERCNSLQKFSPSSPSHTSTKEPDRGGTVISDHNHNPN